MVCLHECHSSSALHQEDYYMLYSLRATMFDVVFFQFHYHM